MPRSYIISPNKLYFWNLLNISATTSHGSATFFGRKKGKIARKLCYKKKGELGLWDSYDTNQLQPAIIMWNLGAGLPYNG
jgi:hypothetical protein